MRTQQQLLEISSVDLEQDNQASNFYVIDVDEKGLVGYWVHVGGPSWIAKGNMQRGHLFMGGTFGCYTVKGYIDLVKKMARDSGLIPVVDLSPEAQERLALEEQETA